MAAFAANLGIAIIKFGSFAITGATSMLAEAVHSVADTGNQALLLLGGRKANRVPDERHPFGYGRERYFWAFVVSMVLFSVGSLFALIEGIDKLHNPHELDHPEWAVGVLLAAIVLEALSFRTARQVALELKGSQSWLGFIRRTKNPEIAVVLLEDTGALIGLVFALAGVGLAEVTGNPRFDAVGSIAIGLLLGGIAMVLAIENKSMLIGEAADSAIIDRITEAFKADSQVTRLIHLRTLQLGPDDLLVAAKAEFATNLDQVGLSQAIDAVEKRIRADVPSARLIFIEPDQFRPPTTTATADLPASSA